MAGNLYDNSRGDHDPEERQELAEAAEIAAERVEYQGGSLRSHGGAAGYRHIQALASVLDIHIVVWNAQSVDSVVV